jgi:hypothetical protein
MQELADAGVNGGVYALSYLFGGGRPEKAWFVHGKTIFRHHILFTTPDQSNQIFKHGRRAHGTGVGMDTRERMCQVAPWTYQHSSGRERQPTISDDLQQPQADPSARRIPSHDDVCGFDGAMGGTWWGVD